MRTFFLALFVAISCWSFGQGWEHPADNEAFLQNEVAEIYVTLSSDDLNTLLGDSLYTNHHFPASMRYESSAFSDTIASVGFRVRGNTSRGAPKKGFKISINEYVQGQKLKGIEKMNLLGQHNDPSLLRYWFCTTFLTRHGLISSRKSFVKLYINGEYKGLYLNMEHIDDEFLQRRFDKDDEGNLYKASWGADLGYWGTNPNTYREVYELKTNKSENDYSGLIRFLDSLNNLSNADFACYMERNFEVKDYLKSLAAEVVLGHWDGHAYNKNNFYLYQQPSTGKFRFIHYDMDNTVGIDWLGKDWSTRDINEWQNDDRPLVDRLLAEPYYKDVYNAYIDTMVSDLEQWNWYSLLEDQQDLIQSAVLSDSYYSMAYGFQYSDFLDALDNGRGGHVKKGIAEYLDDRVFHAKNQLEWVGNLEPPCELPEEPTRNLVKIVDFLGRETNFRTDMPLIYIYDDGSVEKVFVWKT